MNYLAHLHLADVANSDMLGNLLGDFAKGDPSKQYSQEIVQGIRLHRAIDKFVDTHGISYERAKNVSQNSSDVLR